MHLQFNTEEGYHIYWVCFQYYMKNDSVKLTDYKIKERYCDTAVHTSLICFVKSILG